MIKLTNVTDRTRIFGEKNLLLLNVDFMIARDRYVLFSMTPGLHGPLLDILAGIRPPQRGHVELNGLVSWPMGRQGFIRGKGSGLKMAQLVCNLYGLEVCSSLDLLADLMTTPEYLSKPMSVWPLYVRQEFSFALALIPNFDIYIIDGAVPFEPCRFTKFWQTLFKTRLASRTLILSTYRHSQIREYCSKAIIYERKRFRIEENLNDCIGKYPTRSHQSSGFKQKIDSFNDGTAGEEFFML